MTKRKPPAWIKGYANDFREGKVTVEEIMEEENAVRASESKKKLPQLKLVSVKQAPREMGRSTAPKKNVPSSQKAKPCSGCRYYSFCVCNYPSSMLEHYDTLAEFDRDSKMAIVS